MKAPRVALVHDWLTGMRGGERCLEVLCELFPDAPLYTLLDTSDEGASHAVTDVIRRRTIKTSFVQRLPGARSRYRHYLPLFPLAAWSFDLSDFDLIVSVSHCVAKSVRKPAGARHICYCLTPMRYVWDRQDAYLATMTGLTRLGLRLSAPMLRGCDRRTGGVDSFVAISRFIAESIDRHYGRGAEVIYPPVDVSRFSTADRIDDFYLVVSALVPYKRIGLAIEAAKRLGRRLVIVGDGPEAERLRALRGPSIEFLGWQPDTVVAQLFAKCRAVIFTACDDFGIVPLEAAAAGRPTIAFGKGGAVETIVDAKDSSDGATGVFFHEQSVESVVAAILDYEAAEERFDPAVLRAQARRFDRPIFKERMRRYIEDQWVANCDGPQ